MAHVTERPAKDSGLLAGLAEIALASTVPVVIADAALPDMPLILVNDAFCDMTGRDRSEMLGQNCRFLQPATGAGPAVGRMRTFLEDTTAVEGKFVLPNERRDGTRFLNLLYLAKFGPVGRAPFVLGSQFDITTRTIGQLTAYGEELHKNIADMNAIISGAGWWEISHHDDLAETLDYIATYRLTEE